MNTELPKSQSRILDLLIKENQPLTMEEIRDKVKIYSMQAISRALRELQGSDLIKSIRGRDVTYYLYYNSEKNKDIPKVENLINDEIVKIKDLFSELQKQINKADSKINNIYASIITIMGVFVAIFSLISVNARVVFDLTQNNIYDVIWSVFAVNVVTVVSIIILLIGVHLITKNKKK